MAAALVSDWAELLKEHGVPEPLQTWLQQRGYVSKDTFSFASEEILHKFIKNALVVQKVVEGVTAEDWNSHPVVGTLRAVWRACVPLPSQESLQQSMSLYPNQKKVLAVHWPFCKLPANLPCWIAITCDDSWRRIFQVCGCLSRPSRPWVCCRSYTIRPPQRHGSGFLGVRSSVRNPPQKCGKGSLAAHRKMS